MAISVSFSISWEQGIKSTLPQEIIGHKVEHLNDHCTILTSSYGEAVSTFYKLSDGFALISSKFNCQKDIVVTKTISPEDLLIIGYDLSSANIRYELINNEVILSKQSFLNKTFIFSNLIQLNIFHKANNVCNLLWLLIDKQWLGERLNYISPKYTNEVKNFFGWRKRIKTRDLDLNEISIVRKIFNYPFDETPEAITYFDMKAAANELLAFHIKKALTIAGDPTDNKIERPEVVRLNEIKAYVRKNLLTSNPITITELSKKFAISESTLKRFFKRYSNTSFTEFYNTERLKKAYEIICNNKSEKLQDIAQQLGYKNASYFSKAFKKSFNFYPSEIKSKQI